jgi:hexosaminidase
MLRCIFVAAFISTCLAIWPAPQVFERGDAVLWLAQDFYVSYTEGNVCQSPDICSLFKQPLTVQDPSGFSSHTTVNSHASRSSDIVEAAILRARKALFEQNITPWKRLPRNTLSSYEPGSNDTKNHVDRLDIVLTKPDNSSTFKPLAGELDESYTLTITEEGHAKITAASSTGVLHALNTFTQLFYKHSSGVGVYTKLAPIKIKDAPKFPHRGLNMDVARNWYIDACGSRHRSES